MGSAIKMENLSRIANGDKETMAVLLQKVLDSSPGVITEIKNRYQNSDLNSIKYLAHSLKSKMVLLGHNELLETLKTMEHLAASPHAKSQELLDLIDRLEDGFSTLFDDIRAQLHKLNP